MQFGLQHTTKLLVPSSRCRDAVEFSLHPGADLPFSSLGELGDFPCIAVMEAPIGCASTAVLSLCMLPIATKAISPHFLDS